MLSKRKAAVLMTLCILLGAVLGAVVASSLGGLPSGGGLPLLPAKSTGSTTVVLGASKAPLTANFDPVGTSHAFVEVVKEVTPTVVTITSEKVVKFRHPLSDFFGDEFFRPFFRFREPDQEEFRQQGLGSGVIVSTDGYVLTNYHVVKDADELKVFIGKKSYNAKVVGSDPNTDIAVAKILAKDLPVARLGDSEKIEVGEIVLAIGSPFSQKLEHTVTMGIVSAKGRSDVGLARYEDFIQTDAAINPGNSGGALVNLAGEVIGINTAIVSQSGGYQGIGFAIPINLARKVMEEILTKGKVTRGWLGVWIQDVDDKTAKAFGLKEPRGALVSQVAKDSPADNAGIQQGDVIVEFNGKEIDDSSQLRNWVSQTEPGTTVRLRLLRQGQEKQLTVKLGELPEEEVAARPSRRGTEKLGLRVQNLTPSLAERFGYEGESGVVIVDVRSGSLAEREGLREGDLILEINRKKVRNVDEYEAAMRAIKACEVVLFRVRRGDNYLFVTIEIPED